MFSKAYITPWLLCLAMFIAVMGVTTKAQDKPSADKLEPLIKSGDPIYLDGERLYRPKETEKKAIITYKPEPSYTDQAREKKVEGAVDVRAILSSDGKVKVLYTLKELPDGLTEQASKAAEAIRFEPAKVDGKSVSVIVLITYNFRL